MTLHPALARLERGFRRMWGWCVAKAKDPLGRRRAVTEGQQVTAQETGTMLGIMADAAAAGDDMTDEQRLLLIQAAPGMRAREAVLLSIPNRSSVEENELHMIRREMARIEGRDRPRLERRTDGGWRPQRFASAAAGIVPLLPYIAIAGVFLSLTGWGSSVWNGWRADRLENRVERLTAERDAPCTQDEIEGRTSRQACRTLGQAYDALEEAGQIARAHAAALEAERAEQARFAARERRRQREIQNVLTGSSEPPAWGLRDSGDAPQ